MELYVLDHGDCYERTVLGVARSLEEAREMARAYLASSPYVHGGFDWFGVVRYEPGVVCPADDRIDLDLISNL